MPIDVILVSLCIPLYIYIYTYIHIICLLEERGSLSRMKQSVKGTNYMLRCELRLIVCLENVIMLVFALINDSFIAYVCNGVFYSCHM
jgi:hypothetical protein